MNKNYLITVFFGIIICVLLLIASSCGEEQGAATAVLTAASETATVGDIITLDASESVYDTLQWYLNGKPIDSCKDHEQCEVKHDTEETIVASITVKKSQEGGSLGLGIIPLLGEVADPAIATEDSAELAIAVKSRDVPPEETTVHTVPTVISSEEITVPTVTAVEIAFVDSDPNYGEIGGNVSITKAQDESNLTHYVLYWGSDATTKLMKQEAIAAIAKTGDNLSYIMPTNMIIPSGAAFLLVFTKNADAGEMGKGVAVAIVDIALPVNTAQGISFIDTDNTAGELGGTVTIYRASDESLVTHYVLYWGSNATTKLTGQAALVSIAKTGNDVNYVFSANTIIPSGARYLLVFSKNAAGEMISNVAAIITDAAIPAVTAGAVSFTDSDPDLGEITGSVSIIKAADESNITHYNPYWGSGANSKLSGQKALSSIAKTGSNLNYNFASNTAMPSGATYLLVFSKNVYGEMSTGVSAAITDIAIPGNLAQGITFTDTDYSSGEIAGTIAITKAGNEADVTHYVLYYGTDATTKLSGQAALATIAKTGSNLTVTVADNTAIPAGAKFLIVFTKNEHGETASGVSCNLTDIIKSADASLSGLALSAGTLVPAFAPGTTSYTAALGLTASSLTVTPTTTSSTATLTVNSASVSSGTASNTLAMAFGSNPVVIVVTAEDNVTQSTYTITASRTIAQQAYIKGSNTAAMDNFGKSVAIDGNTAVVGAWQAGTGGIAYIFVRSGTTWSEQATLTAPNTQNSDFFGYSVAISGDTAVIGAYQEDSSQNTITNGTTASADNSASNSGAVYVFLRTGTSWNQQAYLKAPNAEANDNFGRSVAIDGDTIVVGAYQEDSNQTTITNGATASADNSLSDSGAVYVFSRNATTWTQQAYLKAPNVGLGDYFGASVAIDGNTLVVGAYYEDSNQTTITNGATASSNNSNGNAGAAYVFTRADTTWTQQAYLKASNANGNSYFGRDVAIDNETIVVGADGESSNQTTITNGTTASFDNNLPFSGAAYVFSRSENNWTQQAYIKPSIGDIADLFGATVSISGNLIVVGAYGEDSNATSISTGTTASSDNSANSCGAAYAFLRTGTSWSQSAFIKAPNAEANDSFGVDVAVSGDTMVVGADSEDSNQQGITNGSAASSNNLGATSGAVYVFQ